ncbi:hypothetical protein EXE58_06005 [Nocardioides seonyuensis]|uniref:Uncharacterized protein n=1 Tax=Nocardioides seonyuensis TaxID=2518371 RepID=A0A4P7IH34_9ACTN|nr:hypothetical protein EXE58_06005 [Nocardioides seonyuensis]
MGAPASRHRNLDNQPGAHPACPRPRAVRRACYRLGVSRSAPSGSDWAHR